MCVYVYIHTCTYALTYIYLHTLSYTPPHPNPNNKVEVSPVAQTAAVLGVGLLYQGTAHRLMTEFLLGT